MNKRNLNQRCQSVWKMTYQILCDDMVSLGQPLIHSTHTIQNKILPWIVSFGSWTPSNPTTETPPNHANLITNVMMRTYPEGWVGYLYPSPGDGDRVFTGLLGHVFTLEGPVLLVQDLYRDWLQVHVQTAHAQWGLTSLLGVHCEFCPFVLDHSWLLQTGAKGCDLYTKYKQ